MIIDPKSPVRALRYFMRHRWGKNLSEVNHKNITLIPSKNGFLALLLISATFTFDFKGTEFGGIDSAVVIDIDS